MTSSLTASRRASDVVMTVQGTLPMTDAQRSCVAVELDRDPQLLSSLEGAPVASPRWADLQDLWGRCRDRLAPAAGAVETSTSLGQAIG